MDFFQYVIPHNQISHLMWLVVLLCGWCGYLSYLKYIRLFSSELNVPNQCSKITTFIRMTAKYVSSFPYQIQNHRRGWTSASCTRTPLAWWPHWDRRVGGPLGCSRLFRGSDWSESNRSAVFPPGSAGWGGGGCASHRPESAGCRRTCSQSSWPEPGYHGSSAHRLGGGEGGSGEKRGGEQK